MKPHDQISFILIFLSLSASVYAAEWPSLPKDAGGLVLYMGPAKQDVVAKLAKISASPCTLAQILIRDEQQLSSTRALVAQFKRNQRCQCDCRNSAKQPDSTLYCW